MPVRVFAVALTLSVTAIVKGPSQITVPLLRLEREASVDAVSNDLSPIGWVAVAHDGSITISQPQDHNLKFFSPVGRPTSVFGRRGKGPGEFETPNLHGWIGDTLWVGDIDTRRLTLITPARKLSRSQIWPPGIRFREGTAGPLPSFIFAVPWAMYADGTFLTYAQLASDKAPSWMNRPPLTYQPFVRIDADGRFNRVVAWEFVPNKKCYVDQRRKPMCFFPFWAVSRAGGVVVVVNLDRSDSQTDHVLTTAVNAKGDTLFTRVLPSPRVRIPRVVADSIRNGFIRLVSKSAAKGTPLVEFELPESFPPFVRALVARDEKSVWLESGVTTGDRVWHILDVTGRSLGTLRVPRHTELRVVALDRVWAVERDRDGLESVVVYRVQR